MSTRIEEHRERCRNLLARMLGYSGDKVGQQPSALYSASHYAVENSGKLVRATLVYSAACAVSNDIDDSLLDYPACAIEILHTYSLIHDDLPAMDDDDLRRGKPTLHKAFDEATAILVGDGLQARAFELLAESPALSAEQKITMVKVLSEAAGFGGMVGGQSIDIQATGSDMPLPDLRSMHSLKTGVLIRAALALGAIAADANAEQRAALDTYGASIGLAFQVVDDILDVEGDTKTLGKTQGKDDDANKPTYVKLMGLEGARAEAHGLLQAALAALDGFGDSANELRSVARYIVERDR